MYEANLETASLLNADFEQAFLEKANLANSLIAGANFKGAYGLNSTQIKSSCSWQKAKIDDELKQKLIQEPEQTTDCSMQYWFQQPMNSLM